MEEREHAYFMCTLLFFTSTSSAAKSKVLSQLPCVLQDLVDVQKTKSRVNKITRTKTKTKTTPNVVAS